MWASYSAVSATNEKKNPPLGDVDDNVRPRSGTVCSSTCIVITRSMPTDCLPQLPQRLCGLGPEPYNVWFPAWRKRNTLRGCWYSSPVFYAKSANLHRMRGSRFICALECARVLSLCVPAVGVDSPDPPPAPWRCRNALPSSISSEVDTALLPTPSQPCLLQLLHRQRCSWSSSSTSSPLKTSCALLSSTVPGAPHASVRNPFGTVTGAS